MSKTCFSLYFISCQDLFAHYRLCFLPGSCGSLFHYIDYRYIRDRCLHRADQLLLVETIAER